MQVMFQPSGNKYNNAAYTQQPVFAGAGRAVNAAGETIAKSKFFDPVAKKYDNFTEWIARNYYERFYRSSFAQHFVDKTKNVNNMTTHMSAIGATLISGMYTIRTLKNDKLDHEKRKTLALNDVMVWGLSTAGSYLIDSKLANWWDGVTTRFAANYLQQNPKAKRVRSLGDWNTANMYEMIGDKFTLSAEDKNIDKIVKEAESKGYTAAIEGKKVSFKKNGKYAELINSRIDKINQMIASEDYKGLRKPLQKINPGIKGIRDFNLDILKNKRLTTMIDGMGVLKSLFVFGMVYRYIIPVLVMKPANKIGAYVHKKNAEKAENKEIKRV